MGHSVVTRLWFRSAWSWLFGLAAPSSHSTVPVSRPRVGFARCRIVFPLSLALARRGHQASYLQARRGHRASYLQARRGTPASYLPGQGEGASRASVRPRAKS